MSFSTLILLFNHISLEVKWSARGFTELRGGKAAAKCSQLAALISHTYTRSFFFTRSSISVL
jgi:hypothetical protein